MSAREISRLDTEERLLTIRLTRTAALDIKKWPREAHKRLRDEARRDEITQVKSWYDEQCAFILAHSSEPVPVVRRKGLRGLMAHHSNQPMSVRKENPRALFRLYSSRDTSLSGTLRAWVRHLLTLELLSEQDAALVVLDEPKSEFLEEEKRRDREAERSFQANIQAIWDAVAAHATSQGWRYGGSVAQARAAYNKFYHARLHTDQTCGEYVKRLVDHGLLAPGTFTFDE